MSRKIVLLFSIMFMLGLTNYVSADVTLFTEDFGIGSFDKSQWAETYNDGASNYFLGSTDIPSGTSGYSVRLEDDRYETDLTMADGLDTTGAIEINISFWTKRSSSGGTNNGKVYFNEDGAASTFTEYANYTPTSNTWVQQSVTLTDSKYMFDGFKVRLSARTKYSSTVRYFWFDEVTVTAKFPAVISGSVGSLDGVTMTGLPGSPVTSGGGSYSATVDYGWSGTVTPSKAGYSFSPTNNTYSNVTSDQTSENYTPTLLTYEISGSVGSLDGVTMSGLPGSPVTSGGGSYSATVDYGWSGTVTPSKAGYSFSPTNNTYSNVTSDQTSENYTPTLLTYEISGSVGSLDGVTMTGLPGSPVTSGGGVYSATVDYGWSGTVTPSKSGYTFSPTENIYSNVTSDQTNEDYTPTLLTYVISGNIADVISIYNMDDVTMSGLPGNPVTDEDGAYSATVDYGWNGTVTPTKAGFTFDPASAIYSNVTANQSDDYDAYVVKCTISGSIGSLEDVDLDGFPEIPATDSSGNYTTEVDYGWSGVVTPGKEGYTFSPTELTYSNVTSNVSGDNYTPIINTYTISGYTGSLAGVSLTGLPGSVASDGSGYYIGTVEYGWAGTVVPEIQYYAFEPVQKVYSNVTSDQSSQNYTSSSTIADVNLVGWWTFNGDATDYSGYGNDGTITGAQFVSSEIGTVLDFEGADYVTVPASVFSSVSNNVTVSLWQYGDPDLQPQNDSIFFAADSSGNRVIQAHLPWGSGTVYMDAGNTGSSYDRLGQSATPDEYEGQWNHWAFTKDAIAGEMKVYLNGSLWNSASGKTKGMTGISQFTIGSKYDGTNNYDGMISNFRVYNRVLSDAEIYGLYNASYDASSPSPADNATNVLPITDLSWTAGYLADSHNVYFGTNFDDVNNGIAAVFKGNQSGTTFDPGILKGGVTYYWAVDEVNDLYENSPWIGQVWSFTTADLDMIGWWKFEDDDSDGMTTDSSGFGRDGTLIGDANIVYDLERGNVLNLNHLSNSYVDCGGGPSDSDWAALTSEMTAMAWVKMDAFTQPYQYIVSKGNTYRISRMNQTETLRFYNSGFSPSSLAGTFDVTDGMWHHVAVTYDGVERVMYIDGQIDAYDLESGDMTYNTQNLLIGGHDDWPERCWKGLIDDVRLYDRALSQAEIQTRAGLAYATDPTPANGAVDISTDAVLSWSSGTIAAASGGNDLYLGTSFDDVNSRDASVHVGFLDDPQYDPGTLSGNATYYWVVDTNNDYYQGSPWAGEIWSFTTLDTSLVGLWTFDSNDASDDSANGHDGTLYGDAAIVDDPIRGKVVQLDGDGDYVEITGYKAISGSASRTVCAWIKTSADTSSIRDIVSWGANSSGAKWELTIDTTKLRQIVYSGDVEGTSIIDDGKWHMVCSVFEGSDVTDTILYVDGAQESLSSTDTQSVNTGSTLDVRIGSISTNSRDFEGLIDNVRIYDRALSAAEIWNLYGANKAQEPNPEDKDWNISLTPTLSWTPGQSVGFYGQQLYLGTDYDDVFNRDASVYVGALDVNSYGPVSLKLYRNYYWTVDIVDTDGKTWYGDVWSFKTRHVLTQTEGYYMDYFIDGGGGIAAYETIYAFDFLGLTGEFSENPTLDGYQGCHYLLSQISLGNWVDDNGLLLYPDGDARYRVLHCGGGSSVPHAENMMAPEGSGRIDAQERVKDFYANGGGFVGNCAGAALSFETLGVSGRADIFFHFFDGFKGDFTNLAGTYTDFEIPDGVTERQGYVLPKSPLLKYYDFGGDYYISNVRQNGGNWCKYWDSNKHWPWGVAEVLTVYNDKIEGEVVREGYKCVDGASCWAYKRTEESGRMAPCGGHPEGVEDGERLLLESSLFQYAMDGGGCPVVKAALADGVTRQMDDNSTVGHEKIGDKQYHHFTIDVPQGATELEIALDGSMYDMDLYAKYDDFAFRNEPDVIAASNGSGNNETITINNPTPGTWYIGVKCVTVPTRTKHSKYWEYTGNLETQNGLAYDITATID